MTTAWHREYVYIDAIAEVEAKLRIWDPPDPDQMPARRPLKKVGDALPDVLAMARERTRWPNTRSGEREPIIWPVRLGVSRRDDFTCRKCHLTWVDGVEFELDHVIPWSAGGSDRSDNLRLLCKPCNQERSNYHDALDPRPQRFVTWWCAECWSPDASPRRRSYTGSDAIDYFNISHRVDPEVACVWAYCAECRDMWWTDVTI